MNPVYFPQGHLVIGNEAASFGLSFNPQENQVTLVASLQSDAKPLSAPPPGRTATTLAIHMDQQVAIDLYSHLQELGRSMGWPLPK